MFFYIYVVAVHHCHCPHHCCCYPLPLLMVPLPPHLCLSCPKCLSCKLLSSVLSSTRSPLSSCNHKTKIASAADLKGVCQLCPAFHWPNTWQPFGSMAASLETTVHSPLFCCAVRRQKALRPILGLLSESRSTRRHQSHYAHANDMTKTTITENCRPKSRKQQQGQRQHQRN